jgi:hypothetical protein
LKKTLTLKPMKKDMMTLLLFTETNYLKKFKI